MEDTIYSYINGNYYVSLSSDGTKIYRTLRVGESPISKFPDSIDLKITNKCSIGCSFCHESSNPLGKSFNVDKTIKILDTLPKVGIEVAIGGGDITENDSFKDLLKLLSWMSNNNFVPRLTINSKSLKNLTEDKLKDICEFTDSFGISINNIQEYHYASNYFNNIVTKFTYYTIVYHIIAGIFPITDIKNLINQDRSTYRRILILGYKNFGRAFGNPPKYDLSEWEKELKLSISDAKENRDLVIGFDNLAIDQLGIKSLFSKREWESKYMGNEFTHSMYIDAVSEEFAPTSRDTFRISWDNIDIINFFNKYKNEN